jgi:hypothetical protein
VLATALCASAATLETVDVGGGARRTVADTDDGGDRDDADDDADECERAGVGPRAFEVVCSVQWPALTVLAARVLPEVSGDAILRLLRVTPAMRHVDLYDGRRDERAQPHVTQMRRPCTAAAAAPACALPALEFASLFSCDASLWRALHAPALEVVGCHSLVSSTHDASGSEDTSALLRRWPALSALDIFDGAGACSAFAAVSSESDDSLVCGGGGGGDNNNTKSKSRRCEKLVKLTVGGDFHTQLADFCSWAPRLATLEWRHSRSSVPLLAVAACSQLLPALREFFYAGRYDSVPAVVGVARSLRRLTRFVLTDDGTEPVADCGALVDALRHVCGRRLWPSQAPVTAGTDAAHLVFGVVRDHELT